MVKRSVGWLVAAGLVCSVATGDPPAPPPFPFASDPMKNNYLLLPDYNLGAIVANQGTSDASGTDVVVTTSSTTANAWTQSTTWNSPAGSPWFPIYSHRPLARGRFLSPTQDQLVVLSKTDYSPANFTFTWTLSGVSTNTPAVPAFSFTTGPLDTSGYWENTDGVIASGDVDGYVDNAGNLGTEVAIVTEDANQALQLRVITYASPSAVGQPTLLVPVITLPLQLARVTPTNNPGSPGNGPYPGSLDVQMGDVNGDGLAEIAVTYQTSGSGSSDNGISTYLYTYDRASGTMSLLGSGVQITSEAQYYNPLQTAAGDLDGDGRSDLAVLFPHNINGTNAQLALSIVTYPQPAAAPGLASNSGGTVFTLTSGNGSGDLNCWYINNNASQHTKFDIAIAAGTFRLNATKGFPMTRKQLAVCWTNVDANAHFNIYVLEYTSPYSPVTPSTNGWTNTAFNVISDGSTNTLTFANQYSAFNEQNGQVSFSLLAGNLVGQGDVPASYTDQLALAYNTTTNTCTPGVSIFSVDYSGSLYSGTLKHTQDLQFPSGGNSNNLLPRITPYDPVGNSLILGTPVHLTLVGHIQPDYVLQQPPQHMDYLPSYFAANVYGIVNVSRNSAFAVQYGSSTSTAGTQTLQNQVNLALGASGSLSVQGVLKAGIPLIATEQTTLQGEVTGSIGANGSWALTNENAEKVEKSLTVTTTSDDVLGYSQSDVDVWAYRLYGTTANPTTQPAGQNADAAFYQVVQQGSTVQASVAAGTGLLFYSPSHEVGNVLSYPVVKSSGFNASPFYTVIPDLGSITYTETDGSTGTWSQPLTVPTQVSWGGNGGTFSVGYSNSSTTSTTWGWGANLAGSLELQLGEKLSGDELVARESVNVTGQFQLNASLAYSGNYATSSTTSFTDSVSVALPNGSSDTGYYFYPLMYVDTSGALRFRFAAGTDYGGSTNFWTENYSLPDPAVLLPQKFINVSGGETWGFNYDQTALQAKQILLTQTTVNPLTGQFDVLGAWPTAGQPVRLQINFNNYSVGSDMDAVPVRFDLVELDGVAEATTPTGAPARQVLPATSQPNPGTAVFIAANGATAFANNTPITSVSGTRVPPRGIAQASYVLDTTDLGPTDGSLSRKWRIYAVLDPDNTITQTHGWRWATVTFIPPTKPNAGDVYTITVQDQAGDTLETINYSVAAGTSPSLSGVLTGLVNTFNASTTAATYNLVASSLATSNDPDQQAAAVTFEVVCTDAGSLPPPATEFRPGIQVPASQPAQYTGVYFVTSASTTGGGGGADQPSFVATSLEPGQNNTGYLDITVYDGGLVQATGPDLRQTIQNLQPTAILPRNFNGRPVRTTSGALSVQQGRQLPLVVKFDGTPLHPGVIFGELLLRYPSGQTQQIAAGPIIGIGSTGGGVLSASLVVPNVPGDYTLVARVLGKLDPSYSVPLTITANPNPNGTSSQPPVEAPPPPADPTAGPTPPPAVVPPPGTPGPAGNPLARLLQQWCGAFGTGFPGLFAAGYLTFAAYYRRLRRRLRR